MSTDQNRSDQPEAGPDPVQDTRQDTVELSTTTPAGEPTLQLDTTQYPTTQYPTTQYPTTEFPTTEYAVPPLAQQTAPVAETRPDGDQLERPVAPPRAAPRVGTIVWGLVLAVIGAGVIVAAAGYEFDLELASIALLALAGIGLVVGSIATSARRRKS